MKHPPLLICALLLSTLFLFGCTSTPLKTPERTPEEPSPPAPVTTLTNVKLPGPDYSVVPFETPPQDVLSALSSTCFATGQEPVIIRTPAEYEHLKRTYGTQGPYTDFSGDRMKKRFTLPFEPLDSDRDNDVDVEDLTIYVDGKNLRVQNGKLLLFKTTPPYTAEGEIPIQDVVTYDAPTRTLTFTTAPKTSVSVSARSFFTKNPACTLKTFDFSKKTIIGKPLIPSGCATKGFERNVIRSDTENKVTYVFEELIDSSRLGEPCPELFLGFGTDWILVPKIPRDYAVSFEKVE